MAAKVIAQMIISGTTIMTKAFFSAYQQALRNAKVGGAPGVASTAVPTKFKIRPDEALKILNIEKDGLTKKVLDERYKIMFGANDPSKGGSFYIQSKIYRSREVLEQEVLGITPDLPQDYGPNNPDPNAPPGTAPEAEKKDDKA